MCKGCQIELATSGPKGQGNKIGLVKNNSDPS